MPQGHVVKNSLFQIVSFYSVIRLNDVFHRFLIVYTPEYVLRIFPQRLHERNFALVLVYTWILHAFAWLHDIASPSPLPTFFLFLAVHFYFKVIRVFFGFS